MRKKNSAHDESCAFLAMQTNQKDYQMSYTREYFRLVRIVHVPDENSEENSQSYRRRKMTKRNEMK